ARRRSLAVLYISCGNFNDAKMSLKQTHLAPKMRLINYRSVHRSIANLSMYVIRACRNFELELAISQPMILQTSFAILIANGNSYPAIIALFNSSIVFHRSLTCPLFHRLQLEPLN